MRHNMLRVLSLSTLMLVSAAALAAPAGPATPLAATAGVTPVAMCGHTCSRGGRYIPGPPEVCYANGLEYCGSSRGGGGGGYGFSGGGRGGYGEGYGGRGGYGGGGCRTITVERDDGTVRRIRRCD
jgi:hypothetical protein